MEIIVILATLHAEHAVDLMLMNAYLANIHLFFMVEDA